MKFSQSIPETPRENDRVQLKAGDVFSITGIIISEQTRYKKVAKINGYKLGTREPVKYYTTGTVIIKDCERILDANQVGNLGQLKEPVDVQVIEVTSANKQKYLVFKDPA